MAEQRIKVKLVKSLIGQKPDIRKTAEALGLRKINFEKEMTENPQINGMLFKVKHLIKVAKI